MNPTTEFDHLMKRAFTVLYPHGSSINNFKAKPGDNCYSKVVKPDYIVGDKWVDFKLSVSYREKRDVAWRPSALYASLRKYLDHADNHAKQLVIVYGNLFGTIDDVKFPILRGGKILIHGKDEFVRRIKLIPASKVLTKLKGTRDQWIAEKVLRIIK